MFAYFAVALAASGDLRVDSHMREDPSIAGAETRAVVMPSGAIQLLSDEEPQAPDAPAAESTDAADSESEAPVPSPTPRPTMEPTSDSAGKNKLNKLDPQDYLPTPIPNHPWTNASEFPDPASHVDRGLSLAEAPAVAEAPTVAVPPVLEHVAVATPTLDAGTDYAEKMSKDLAYNKTHEAEQDATLAKRLEADARGLEADARVEANALENLTLAEAAGAVMNVMAGEPLRVMSDMESFLLELKRALVGPPMHEIMRAQSVEVQKAGLSLNDQVKHMQELQVANLNSKPTGETEYVVSVNGIMEYRPPTAHGAVRVVSVLLLLASAIVLGIGWRYGSAPGMYPYVEDCRL